MSLLLTEGHQAARQYPLAVVWSEANIVRQRNADRRKRDTAVMQRTLSSIFSEKAGKSLPRLLERTSESD